MPETPDEIVLQNARARVGVLPARGAALSRYEYRAGDGWRPLLAGPDGRVSLVMAPWQNRISGGGFTFESQTVALERNTPLDPFPLHGNAWLLPWQVAERTAESLTLRLVSDGPGPYRYEAEVLYALSDEGALETVLAVTNTGPRLPFGLGFHPNFTRTQNLSLTAPAETLTLQDQRYLPTETLSVTAQPDLDFTAPRGIPAGPINNEFGGWTGEANVKWPEWALGCRIACPGITRYLLHTPGTDAPYVSFEPVTHSIDAFNRPEPLTTGGLVALDPRKSLALTMTITPHRL